MRPDFVIIGAQKAASTALMRYVSTHPQVFMPRDETRYFRDPWFQMEEPSVLDAALKTDKSGVQRWGIKCPDLLGSPVAPQRLRDVLGEVQLIALLRDPVARALSAYYWGMQWGWLPLIPPEIGLRRLVGGGYPSSYPRAPEVLEFGLYAKHLRNYLRHFSRDRLFVLTGEDLREDLPGSARAIFEYLHVDQDIPVIQRVPRVNESVYSTRRLRLLQRRHKYILREFPGFPGKYLQPARGVRARTINRAISVVDRLILARLVDNTKPELSDELTERLRTYYRPDVQQLEKMLDRDLSGWLGDEPVSQHSPTPKGSLHG